MVVFSALTLCGDGSEVTADRAWSDLQVTGVLSVQQSFVPQLHGCTTPTLFTAHSTASAKCNSRPHSIVWCRVCLSCTRTLTSSPSEFRETVNSQWIEADLHKEKDTLNTFSQTAALKQSCLTLMTYSECSTTVGDLYRHSALVCNL